MSLFVWGIFIQGTANCLLAFGGLLLAFYTLKDDEAHTVRQAVISRLQVVLWALILVSIVLIIFVVPIPIGLRLDAPGLDDSQDAALFDCLRLSISEPFSPLRMVFADEESRQALDAFIRGCFKDSTGAELVIEERVGFRLEYKTWGSGRMLGLLISFLIMTAILWLFRAVFLNVQPSPKAVANCFAAVVIGVFLQIFLQGSGDMFANPQTINLGTGLAALDSVTMLELLKGGEVGDVMQ